MKARAHSWRVAVGIVVACFGSGSITGFEARAATNCVQPPPGLIGWWPAEDGALNVVDGTRGLLINSVQSVPGVVRRAFGFHALAYARIPDAPVYRLTNSVTIEAWVNWAGYDAHNSYMTILAKWAGSPFPAPATNLSYNLSVDYFGRVYLGVSGTGSDTGVLLSSNGVPVNQWAHVAGTYDASVLKIYINGVFQCQTNYGGGIYPAEADLGIGGDPSLGGSVSSFFQGAVDEVSLYNRALTAEEIQAIVDAGSAGKCRTYPPPVVVTQPVGQSVYVGDLVTFSIAATGEPPLAYQWYLNDTPLLGATSTSLTLPKVRPQDAGSYFISVSNEVTTVTSSNAILTVNPPPPCLGMPADLVSWWRGENSVVDSSGSNDAQAPYGMAYGPGKVGQAFSWPSLVAFDSPSLRLTNAMTVSAWVNPTAFGGYGLHTIISKIDENFSASSRQVSYFLGADAAGLPYFRVSADGLATSNATVWGAAGLPLGQWSLVCASYDGASLRLYTNGGVAAETPYAGGIFPGSAMLGIGAGWTGGLDEIMLYGRALSDTEIFGLYAASVSGICPVIPTISQQPRDQSVPLGQDAFFRCAASGTPPFDYQWSYYGSPLAGATNQALLVRCGTNSLGSYSVLVSNGAGSALSSNATLTPLPPAVCSAAPAGAISWWTSDGTAADLVGTNRAQVSPDLYGAGKVDGAFDLTSTWISVPNSLSLNFGSNADFSIEAWVKSYVAFQDPGTRLIYPIVPVVQKRAAPGLDGVGYLLALYNGRLAFWLGASRQPPTAAPLFAAAEPDLRDGIFHHLAVTVHRDAVDGGKLYVDGEMVLSFDPTAQQGDLGNTGALLIGTSGVATNSYFNGFIDELAIYRRVLSDSEIRAVVLSGSAGKCKSSPVLSVASELSQNNATLSWAATGFDLYQTPSLAIPVIWSPVTNLPTVSTQSGNLTIQVPVEGPSRFFELRARGY